jgi:type IV pilus assembly protein PilF
MSNKLVGLMLVATVALLMACGSKTVKDSSQRNQAAVYNMQLASDYLRQGNLSLAKEKIERALEQDSSNSQAHMVAGLLFQQLREFDKAEQHFDRAHSLSKKNSDISNSYAQFLCSRGKAERGEKMLIEAANDRLYKTPETSYVNAGYCVRGSGNLKGAEAHFRKALSLRPNYPPALLAMADLELQQKQFLPARAFLERFIAASSMTPAALLMGVNIERSLGNTSQADDYARRLRDEFPNSDEYRALRGESK